MNKAAIVLGLVGALALSSPGYAIDPENGWWWNPAESGRGFNIEVQHDTVFIATFIYDAAGNPEWFSGGGQLVNDRWDGDLQRFEGGQCPSCSYTPPSAAGTLSFAITFTDTSAARVQMGSRTIDIERFPFAFDGSVDDFLGAWSVVSRPGFLTDGEFLVFTGHITLDNGAPALAGVRGDTSRPAVLSRVNDDVLLVLLDSSTSFYKWWLVTPAGFNRLAGEFWLQEKSEAVPSPGTGDLSVWHRSIRIGELRHAPADNDARDQYDQLLYRQQPRRDAKRFDPTIIHRMNAMIEQLER